MKPSDRSTFVRSTELQQQYRECLADLDIPTHEIDELIDIVDSIMAYFVDSAFNVQTDQITLRSARSSFNAPLGHGMMSEHPENRTANVRSNGVEKDSNPEGPGKP